MKTNLGEIPLDVPRNRYATFDPIVVPKHQRMSTSIEHAILTMYFTGLILFALFAGTGSGHKFYVSITQADVNPDSHRIEVSARIFSDDLENAVEAVSGHKLRLGSGREDPKADSLLFSYLLSTLEFKQDGAAMDITFIGKEVEADVTWIYVETKSPVSTAKPLLIRNALLQEKFPDQKNIVNLKFGKETVSQIHTKDHVSYSYPVE